MISVQNNKTKPTEDFIRLQDLLYLCLSRWRWFVISLVVTISIAVLYILTTPPIYIRSASILIKEDSKSQSISGDVASMFSDLGLSQANANVNNELIAIQSPSIILETVKRLHLDINYQVKGTFHKKVLYGSELPVKISFIELADNESAQLVIKLLADGTVECSDFVSDNRDIADKTVKGKLNDSIETPLGKIIVIPTSYYTKKEMPLIYISRTNLYNATDLFKQNLTASLSEEKATVIDLSYKDVATQRAEDILSMLISVYKENWVKDKNLITVSTSLFITDRLGVIEQELGDVDEDISSYKSENLVPDVEAASSMYMAQSREANNLLLDLNTQLSMARYIRNYLTTSANHNQLLPANSGIESPSIENQMREYNTLQLQRNNLVSNSSEQNPLVMDFDQSLHAIRKAIISSIDNLIVTLNTQIANLHSNEQQNTAQIAANPNQAKYLLSVGRQQKVKEALYLFLLQKREENELSQAFTAYNTRMITAPSGNLRPIAPQNRNILSVAFALGLLIPIIIIFIRENTNTTVRGRKDLENLTLPFIGEIPLLLSEMRDWRFLQKQPELNEIVVQEGKKDIINEAFRVLRTNLEFMTAKKVKSNVIILTSFNPGSGKTFLTMNVAISLAIKGKKVLVIDGDLRHASASTFINSPKQGLSNYLGKQIDNPDDIIVAHEKYNGLSILPVGTIPPNPTELLFEERLEVLIADLRNKYDYIFIDCPPIDIVADTQIIEKIADICIFVVRAGLLERSMLSDLENFYKEERFKNMAMILNATTNSGGRYGYRYGYHYGYASEYHSGENEGRKAKVIRWLLNK